MFVVNVKVKYIRPDYQNLKEWMEDEDNVYIGRKGVVFIDSKRFPEESSTFCNPYKVGKDGDRKEVVKKYRRHLKKLMKDEDVLEEMRELKGKNLGCWCKPEICHGDILLEYVNRLE